MPLLFCYSNLCDTIIKNQHSISYPRYERLLHPPVYIYSARAYIDKNTLEQVYMRYTALVGWCNNALMMVIIHRHRLANSSRIYYIYSNREWEPYTIPIWWQITSHIRGWLLPRRSVGIPTAEPSEPPYILTLYSSWCVFLAHCQQQSRITRAIEQRFFIWFSI